MSNQLSSMQTQYHLPQFRLRSKKILSKTIHCRHALSAWSQWTRNQQDYWRFYASTPSIATVSPSGETAAVRFVGIRKSLIDQQRRNRLRPRTRHCQQGTPTTRMNAQHAMQLSIYGFVWSAAMWAVEDTKTHMRMNITAKPITSTRSRLKHNVYGTMQATDMCID